MPQSFLGTIKSVGLDIGFNSLKVVELRSSGRKVSVYGSNLVGIPSGSVNKNGINNKEKLANAILEAMHHAQPKAISAQNITTALPESLIFSKIISLPGEIKQKELNENILMELADLLPWPIAESYIDWQLLPKQGVKKNNDYSVFIVAALRHLVDDFIAVTKMAGLSISAIETKPIATCRALVGTNDNHTMMLVDIGAEHSSATIVDSGIIRFSSTISIGANASYLTYQGSKSVLLKTPDVKRTAEPLIDNILNNIRYYKTRINNKDTIKEIRLSGGGSNLPNVAQIITDKSKIPTRIGNAATNFNDRLTYDSEALQIFSVSIGLALREIVR